MKAHIQTITRLRESKNRTAALMKTSCGRLGCIALTGGIKNIRPQQAKVHDARFWYSVPTPLRNSTLCDITQIRHGICAAEQVDYLIRVHASSIEL